MIPKSGGYRPLLFPDKEFRNKDARCNEHCQHFKDLSCWIAAFKRPTEYTYKTAEFCSDYKPIINYFDE
jgi:hypothetical protein